MRWLIALCLMATPAFAKTWSTGDCITQSGETIKYVVSNGEGFITYDGGDPYPMFTKRDGDFGIVTHIGSSATFTLAVNLNTGRGYFMVKSDNGKKLEGNVSCKLGRTG